MDNDQKAPSEMEEKTASPFDWGKKVKVVVCENCDRQFVLLETQSLPQCPQCYQSALVALTQEASEQVLVSLPELILAPRISFGHAAQILQPFTTGSWFPPVDLNPTNLMKRLVLLFLPIWLVDSAVKATWQAEAGFDYQVMSHQDRYDDSRGGWASQEVQKTLVRWETRIGRLQRIYHNITAPALNDHAKLMRRLGEFDLTQVKAYDGAVLPEKRWAIGLPERSTKDAWADAVFGLQAIAAQESQKACRAEHLRDFSWTPEFADQNWTLMLVPVYSTFYVDDEGKPQSLLVNGQSGKFSGAKRASIKRAQKTSLVLAGVAALVFLVSLLLSLTAAVVPFMLVLGGIGIVLALIIGIGALVPLLIVWRTNRGT